MLLKLYCSSEHIPRRCPANQGFYSVMYLLWLLNKRGIATEVADTATLPEEDIKRAYNEAVISSVANKRKIREVFGTKRRSAIRFGKAVPALIVYEDISQHPIGVYPHKVRQGGSTERFDVTILEYLTYLERQMTGQPTLEYENRPLTLEEQRRLTRRMQR